MRASRFLAWMAGVVLLPLLGQAAPPRVVATIAPVHSLVAAVMAGVGEPHLIVRGYGSPHTWQLRPSDARALESAALVVWIGAPLEVFLERPLAGLAGGAARVRLIDVEGMTLHAARPGGSWDGHGHEDEDPRAHAEDRQDGTAVDPHLWLDPDNAALAVDAVAQALSRIDPGNQRRYADNAQRMKERLVRMDTEIGRALAPVRKEPFVVLHDAYQYFERHYGLRAAGAITTGPERMPGARRIAALRQQVQRLGARCVFREPQFSSSLVDAITAETGAATGVLDPLGAELEPGPGQYERMMRANATAIVACLAR